MGVRSMKRKTIALCVTGYDKEYETRIAEGIARRCTALDINLLVFASLIRKPDLNSGLTLPESVIKGETAVFDLINYNMLDGIIILGDSIIDESVIEKVHRLAQKNNVPVININDPTHVLDKNITLSDKCAMEFVMKHLVEDHGLTRINFIGGFPGNRQTEERLAGYKKVLTEHNIPVEERRIAYGQFWTKAVDCTREFLKDELPQAIVCASDTMAIFCMDELKNQGYSIPEDIIVTGFDGIADCELYSPTVTTVRRSFAEAGEKAVDMLSGMWQGKEVPDWVDVVSVLEKAESCGCVKKEPQEESYYNSTYQTKDTFMGFTAKLREMNTAFAGCRTSEEVYEALKNGAAFFRFNRLFVCIRSSVEGGGSFVGSGSMKSEGSAYSMMSMLQYGHDVPVGTKFSSEQLLPIDFPDGEKAVFFGFSPLYFSGKFMGYLAYEPTRMGGAGDFFSTWVTAINNKAGNFYKKKDLELVVKELENLNVRDPLTELFNRRGMEKFGGRLVERARKEKLVLTVICADIDGLKPINDRWGHEAGDNAIRQTANALFYAMPSDSVCTRTGGDEFSVILCGEDDSGIEGYISRVSDYLADYNSRSGLPYKVDCSCGYCSVNGGEICSMEAVTRMADDNMYRLKAAKKKSR